MNYLIYGEENFLIEEEINKNLDKYNIDKMNINRYDLSINSMDEILDDCNSFSLFGEIKAVIVDNSIIFNRVKGNDHDIKILTDYLNNPNPYTYLFFVNHNATVDKSKKITKLIKEKGILCECIKKDTYKIVEQLFKPYQIDRASINLLIDRVGDNAYILKQEVNKIKTYKDNDMLVTLTDINELAPLSIDVDIFNFIDHIINKEKDKALTDYQKYMRNNEEPIKIIALLANKFRLMYQASELTRMGYSQQDIANNLKVHIYPVKLAISAGLKYKPQILLHHLELLADLDLDIKTGNIDPYLGLELFILNI